MTAEEYLTEAERLAGVELFKVESIHQIHGKQCLCGFESAVSRDRTKHIMDATIAAARTGWPQTVAALRAVLELHNKVPVYTTEAGECDHGEDCEGVEVGSWGLIVCPDTTDGYTCGECSEIGRDNPDGEWPEWPCATVRAINEHMEAKP